MRSSGDLDESDASRGRTRICFAPHEESQWSRQWNAASDPHFCSVGNPDDMREELMQGARKLLAHPLLGLYSRPMLLNGTVALSAERSTQSPPKLYESDDAPAGDGRPNRLRG